MKIFKEIDFTDPCYWLGLVSGVLISLFLTGEI